MPTNDSSGSRRTALLDTMGGLVGRLTGRLGATAGGLQGAVVPAAQHYGRLALRRLDAELANSDIQVEFPTSRLRITGGPDGVRSIEAAVERAVDDADVHVDYDREGGIDIHIGGDGES